jgi:NDP-sugar pyrophosphorylase family protein
MRNKSRLTVTLSPDLVTELDRMIDKRTIRSRSHAVEVLLRRSLRPRVSAAVLLAGGSPDGADNPALAPFGGSPLIRRMIGHLAGFGIRTFIVLAGRDQGRIESLLGNGESLGVTIRYIEEKRPLGTAGALKQTRALLGDGPFLVLNADVLTDMDIDAFIRFHTEEGCLATIAVKPRQSEKEFGKVMLQGNRITEFIDQATDRGISIVNTGLYLLQPEVLDLVAAGEPAMLETDVFPALARLSELSAFLFQGFWFDIRDDRDYRRAVARWEEKGAVREVDQDRES